MRSQAYRTAKFKVCKINNAATQNSQTNKQKGRPLSSKECDLQVATNLIQHGAETVPVPNQVLKGGFIIITVIIISECRMLVGLTHLLPAGWVCC